MTQPATATIAASHNDSAENLENASDKPKKRSDEVQHMPQWAALIKGIWDS